MIGSLRTIYLLEEYRRSSNCMFSLLSKVYLCFRFMLVACIVCSARAQEEERPVSQPRGLLKRGPLAKGKQTTTTTTPPPQVCSHYNLYKHIVTIVKLKFV